MTAYRTQVAAALHAATIRGPTRYAWLGRASRPLAPALEAEMDEAAREAYLVTSLAHELYASFYCRGQPVPARWGEPAPLAPDPQLIAALSDANTGGGCWQGGWTVARIEDGEAVVTAGVRARIPVDDCRASGGVRPGATVQVRVPKEHLWLSPGFYVALSDAVDAEPARGILRAYWHVTPTGAPRLMRALTSRLNAGEVPFQLKIGDHAFRLDRCDGAVLYLRGERFDAVSATLSEIAAELRAHLRPSIPPFTLELAPGVGLAEHDGGPSSFGTVRCQLVAEAIVRAHRLGLTVVGDRIGAVAARFAESGLDIDAPYHDPSLAGGHVL